MERRRPGASFGVRLGPLEYEIVPADPWAEEYIRTLRGVLTAGEPGEQGRPPRRCLLLRRACRDEDRAAVDARVLPPDVTARFPSGAPAAGWAFALDSLGTANWWHPDTGLCVIAVSPDAPPCPAVLPWPVILYDMLAAGGAVAHAGLAVAGRRDPEDAAAVLLAAPAGGGKSTALRRLPAPWRVLGDDAALVWPEGGRWYASPLPTWGYLLNRGESCPGVVPWRTGERHPVRLVAVLRKSEELRLRPLRPAAAVSPLYLALSEYSPVFAAHQVLAPRLFASAAELARSVPAATLELPPDGDYWGLLAAAVQ